MQKDASTVSPPLPSNAAVGGEVGTSGDPSRSETETGSRAGPKTQRKPSMSKVILQAVANKGVRSRVSLAALKKAMVNTGYNMANNTWRLKRALKNLVNKGLLKQVAGNGASGSFRLGKKGLTFKSKRKVKSRQREQRGRRAGQRRSLLSSTKSHKRPFKGVRRVAQGHGN